MKKEHLNYDSTESTPRNLIYNASVAVSELGEAIRQRNAWSFLLNVGRAARCIEEIFSQCEDSDFSEEEAQYSSNFHTYLRKYTDDPLSTLLWQLWNYGYGAGAWKAGIQDLMAAQFYKQGAFYAQNTREYDADDPKAKIMHSAFRAWFEVEENAKTFIEFIKEIK